MERTENHLVKRPLTLSRFWRLLARIETRVVLAALLLAGVCIGVGGLIADRLVIVRLLAGTGG